MRRQIREPAAYYDLLSEAVLPAIEIWITQYLHVLRGKDSVVQSDNGDEPAPLP